METSVTYTGLKDREAKVAEQEAKGLTMKHDNFDAGWKAGDEPRGAMLFTDATPATIPMPPVRDLAAEIDRLTLKIEELEKKSAPVVGL